MPRLTWQQHQLVDDLIYGRKKLHGPCYCGKSLGLHRGRDIYECWQDWQAANEIATFITAAVGTGIAIWKVLKDSKETTNLLHQLSGGFTTDIQAALSADTLPTSTDSSTPAEDGGVSPGTE